MSKLEYESKAGNVNWSWITTVIAGKLQTLKQHQAAYKIRQDNGSPRTGVGNFTYLESRYKEPQKIKNYDFGKYSDGVTTETEDEDTSKRKKFDLKNIDFTDERNEIDPIQTDTSDSKYLFDNKDAIIVNLKKGNPN